MRLRILTLATLILAFCVCSPVLTAGQNVGGLLLVVNNNGDSHDAIPGDTLCANAGGQCTLRAAIEESNAGSARNAIIFDLAQPAAIDLTLGELSITNGLDLLGPGARKMTVRRSTTPGTANFRIFHVPAGQTNLNIRGITIRNGNDASGGGLLVENGSVVALYDLAITANSATAGGGIANFGTLSVTRCLINSNVAVNQGGGIVSLGPSTANVTIISSTLTENSASISGAINNHGTMLLINDTISRNSASQVSSSILSGPDGTVKVLNTIIGRDISQPGPALQGQFQSMGNNIVTDPGPSTGFSNGINGDQVGNAIDPLLGPLADNGGETDTMALLAGSPAINNGNLCAALGPCPQLPGMFFRNTKDQRRFHRILFGSNIDIGAYAATTAITSPTATYSLSLSGLGQGSRHLNSIVIIIDTTTLEKHYSVLGPGGTFSFQKLPLAAAFVVEVRAKRAGMQTPMVFPLD